MNEVIVVRQHRIMYETSHTLAIVNRRREQTIDYRPAADKLMKNLLYND